MMRKLYVLNFNPNKVNTSALHKAIDSSEIIITWSHFLPDSYIIQSRSSAKEISMELRSRTSGDFTHYVFRLDKNYHGYMPKKQWEWLKKRAKWWN